MGEWGQEIPRGETLPCGALWYLLQLLSHQPSARAEKTVNKDVVTREFLPNLGLLVAS